VRGIEAVWYGRRPLAVLGLLPLSALFCAGVALRRACYRWGLLRRHRLGVPVVVVGNLVVGGTGKTPLVAELARLFAQAGWRPGLVSRGYGGRARHWPQQVRPDSDPAAVGDEAVLLARLTGCPMAVGPDRVAAARSLLEHTDVNLILADDGLQHLALERDLEIVVIDGVRRHGNRLCLHLFYQLPDLFPVHPVQFVPWNLHSSLFLFLLLFLLTPLSEKPPPFPVCIPVLKGSAYFPERHTGKCKKHCKKIHAINIS